MFIPDHSRQEECSLEVALCISGLAENLGIFLAKSGYEAVLDAGSWPKAFKVGCQPCGQIFSEIACKIQSSNMDLDTVQNHDNLTIMYFTCWIFTHCHDMFTKLLSLFEGAPRVFVLGAPFPLSSAVKVYTSLQVTPKADESERTVILLWDQLEEMLYLQILQTPKLSFWFSRKNTCFIYNIIHFHILETQISCSNLHYSLGRQFFGDCPPDSRGQFSKDAFQMRQFNPFKTSSFVWFSSLALGVCSWKPSLRRIRVCTFSRPKGSIQDRTITTGVTGWPKQWKQEKHRIVVPRKQIEGHPAMETFENRAVGICAHTSS